MDKAFQKLGFVHADMRISNVMEHHLDAEPMYPKGFTSRKQRKQAVGVLTEPKTNTFKIPGGDQATCVTLTACEVAETCQQTCLLTTTVEQYAQLAKCAMSQSNLGDSHANSHIGAMSRGSRAKLPNICKH